MNKHKSSIIIMNTHHESSTITNITYIILQVSFIYIILIKELEDNMIEAYKQLKRNIYTFIVFLHLITLKPDFPSVVDLLYCCLYFINSAALQCSPAARVRHSLPALIVINPLR